MHEKLGSEFEQELYMQSSQLLETVSVHRLAQRDSALLAKFITFCSLEAIKSDKVSDLI